MQKKKNVQFSSDTKKTVINKKVLNFILFLHIYDISQIDEWIEKINSFKKLNVKHNLRFYVNIPIGKNIEKIEVSTAIELSSNITIFDLQNCLNDSNINTVKYIISLFISKLAITPIFMVSKNKGVDIGGFFQFLQVLKLDEDNFNFDYLIKIHTKGDKQWRQHLAKILNRSYSNEDLKDIDLVGSMVFKYPCYNFEKETNSYHLENICKTYLGMSCKSEFRYVPGTIFLCSKQLIEKLLKINLRSAYENLNDNNTTDINWKNIMNNPIIFNHHVKVNKIDADSCKYINLGNNFALLNVNKIGVRDGMVEHAWERIIGVLAETLGGKIKRI